MKNKLMLFALAVMFVMPTAFASSYVFASSNDILIVKQDMMDKYIHYYFREISEDRWLVKYTIDEQFYNDVTACYNKPDNKDIWESLFGFITGTDKNNCIEAVRQKYFSEYDTNSIRNDVRNLNKVPLKSLTKEIHVDKQDYNFLEKSGEFYIDFPNGFKAGESAEFGFHSTIINTTTSSSFITNESDVNNIPLGINLSSNNQYEYETVENSFSDYTAYINEKPLGAHFIRVETYDHYFNFQIKGAANVIGIVDENKITYPNSFDFTNISYQFTTNSIKEIIMLADNTTIGQKFEFDIQTDLTPVLENGDLIWKNSDGGDVLKMPRPFADDAAENHIDGDYVLTQNGINWEIEVSISESWLANAIYPVVIDPTVIFSTSLITSVKTAPLSKNTFVIAYCDDINDDISFQVYYANGTQLLAETDADTTAGNCAEVSVSVSAFNSTHFVIGWADQIDNDATFAVYNTTGTAVVAATDVDTTASTQGVSVSAFDSTHFVFGWSDQIDQDASFSTYYSNGTLIATADVDTTQQGTEVSVSTFNSTHFVIGWFDYFDGQVSFAIGNYTGVVVSQQNVESPGTGSFISVSTFNSTAFVISWWNKDAQDASFRTYYSNGTAISAIVDADAAIGTADVTVQAAALNSTHFVISWYDSADYDLTYAIYNSAGTVNVTATDIEAWPTGVNAPFAFHAVASQESGTAIGFCGDNWIMSYANTTTQAIWKSYTPSGTTWDGTCALPTISLTYPSNNAFIKNPLYINGTAVSISPDSIVTNDSLWTINSGTFSSWSFLNTSAVIDGIYSVMITVNDTYGQTNSTTANFTVDNTNPIVSFITPTPNNNSVISTTTVTINATHTETNPDKLLLYIDGALNQTISYTGAFTNVTKTFTQGLHNFSVTVNDTAGNSNSTGTYYVTIDTITPTIAFIAPTPANNSFVNTNAIVINVSHTETNPDKLLLYIDGALNQSVSYTGAFTNFSKTLTEGLHNFSVTVNDTAGNSNLTGTYYVTIDVTNPAIALTYPSINAFVRGNTINITGTASDTNYASVVTNNSKWNTNTGTYASWKFVNTTTIGDGFYSVLITANDSAGNSNTTIANFTVDNTDPIVAFTSPTPANNSNLNVSSIVINVTHTETNPDKLVLYIDGAINQTISYAGAFTNLSKTLSEGLHNYSITVNDTAGNSATTGTYYVTIDTITPAIQFVSPTPTDDTVTNQNVTINVTASDTNLDKIIINVNGSVVKTCTSSPCSYNLTSDGVYTYYSTANDTFGNANSTETRVVTISTAAPLVSFISPTPANNSFVNSATFVINISHASGMPDTLVLYIDGVLNASQNYSGSYTNFTRTLSQGLHNFSVTVNDTASNSATTGTRFVTIDTTNPAIALTSPANNAFLKGSTINITGTASDTNPVSIVTNNTRWTTNSGTYTSWKFVNVTTVTDGYYSVLITANDSAGNTNTTISNFTVDNTNPVISYTSPTPNDNAYVNSSSVTFNVTHTETNPDKIILYINGTANETRSYTGAFTNFTKTMADGVYTYYIWLNDSAGNTAVTATRTLTVDTVAPTITLTYPTNNAFLKGLSFEINGTASDIHSDSVVTNNSLWTANTGTYSSWKFVNTSAVPDGYYSVRVTANDTYGNSNNVIANFTVDNTPPTIDFVAPTLANGGSQSSSILFINVTHTEVNPGTLRVYIDGVLNTSQSYTGASTYIEIPTAYEGWHNYSVTVNDSAGNSNSTETRTINFDTTNITQCARILTNSSLTYTLSQNISSSGTCIELRAGTLDCDGYYISGGGTAILVNSTADNTKTIKNCNLANLNKGIDIYDDEAGLGAVTRFNITNINMKNVSYGIIERPHTNAGGANSVGFIDSVVINQTTVGYNASKTINGVRVTDISDMEIYEFSDRALETDISDKSGTINLVDVILGYPSDSSYSWIKSDKTGYGTKNTFQNLVLKSSTTEISLSPDAAETLDVGELSSSNTNLETMRAKLANAGDFNTTADVLFKSTPLQTQANVYIMRDSSDSGSFTECPANVCTVTGLSAGNLAFNVTGWTTYGALEISTSTSPTGDVLETNTSTFNINISSYNLTGGAVSHIYNGTSQSATLIASNSTLRRYQINRTIPLVEVNDSTLYWNWNISATFLNGSTANVTTAQENHDVLWAYYITTLATKERALMNSVVAFNTTVKTDVTTANTSVKTNFNNTSYNSTFVSNTSSTRKYTSSITMPIPPSSATLYVWNSTLNVSYGGQSFLRQSDNSNITVEQFAFVECDVNYTVKAFNFTFYTEEDDTIVNGTGLSPTANKFEATFTTYANGSSDSTSYNFSFAGGVSYQICLKYPESTFLTNAHIRYSNTSYSTRNYFMNNYSVDNVTDNISLYLLENTASSPISFVIRESNGIDSAENVVIQAMRYYPDKNVYRTVAMALTDGDGKGFAYLKMNTAFHKFRLYRDGAFMREIEQGVLGGADVSAGLTLTYSLTITSLAEIMEIYEQVEGSCSANNATAIVTCTYDDSSTHLQTMYLTIQKLSNVSWTSICTNSSINDSGTLTCSAASAGNGTYYYWLYGKFASNTLMTIKIADGSFNVGLLNIFGSAGLLFSAILIIALVMIGSFNPIVTIFMGITGLVVSSILGMLDISLAALVGIIIVGIIIAIKSRG